MTFGEARDRLGSSDQQPRLILTGEAAGREHERSNRRRLERRTLAGLYRIRSSFMSTTQPRAPASASHSSSLVVSENISSWVTTANPACAKRGQDDPPAEASVDEERQAARRVVRGWNRSAARTSPSSRPKSAATDSLGSPAASRARTASTRTPRRSITGRPNPDWGRRRLLVTTSWPQASRVTVLSPIHATQILLDHLVEDDLASLRQVQQGDQLILAFLLEEAEEELGAVGQQVATCQGMLVLKVLGEVDERWTDLLHADAARAEGGDGVCLDQVGERQPALVRPGGMISGLEERTSPRTG